MVHLDYDSAGGGPRPSNIFVKLYQIVEFLCIICTAVCGFLLAIAGAILVSSPHRLAGSLVVGGGFAAITAWRISFNVTLAARKYTSGFLLASILLVVISYHMSAATPASNIDIESKYRTLTIAELSQQLGVAASDAFYMMLRDSIVWLLVFPTASFMLTISEIILVMNHRKIGIRI